MLPKIPYETTKKQRAIVTFRGLNWSDNYQEGSIEDSVNMSFRRYPYFATARPRKKDTDVSDNRARDLAAWNGLLFVDENDALYYQDKSKQITYIAMLDSVSGPRTFVSMYHKIVIWPDKKYINVQNGTMTVHDLESECKVSGGVIITEYTAPDELKYMQVEANDTSIDFADYFSVNDYVNFSGFVDPMNAGYKKILQIQGYKMLFADGILSAESIASDVTFARDVPDMDGVCESGNRLWGYSNATNTIYSSRLDDPANFHDFGGEADDSWALDVATEGPFTGCAKLSSSVLFFKENCLHKVLGSYNSEYQMNTQVLHGVANGSGRSIQTINGILYYLGTNGVYAYNGGTPTLISPEFGEKRLFNGVAGTDNTNYYLSAYDGEKHVFLCYSTLYGMWVKEDELQAYSFATVDGVLYMSTEDGVFTEGTGAENAPVDFLLRFKPFYEQPTSNVPYFSKKRYQRLLARVEMTAGTYADFYVSMDGKPWKKAATLTKPGLQSIIVPIGRCDQFDLKIEGSGCFTLMGILREFKVEGDR